MGSKVSKASVNYRMAGMENFGRRCGTCSMYQQGGGCTLVAGVILAISVCDKYEAKDGPGRAG